MTEAINTQTVLTFDGVDDYIDFGRNDIGGAFAQGNSAFTVSGWMNPHRLTDKATSYKTRNVFFARSSDRYSDNFEFGISEGGNLDVYIDECVSKVIRSFGNGELTINQWHFFAIIFNSGQVTVYLDDNDYTELLTGTSLNRATSAVTLGATLHKKVYFAGQLANVSVWNIACTPAQIQTHRAGLIVGDEEGLVAYWKLDEGEGTTVKNRKGNSFSGNLRGNPTWDIVQIPFVAASPNLAETEIATTILPPTDTPDVLTTKTQEPPAEFIVSEPEQTDITETPEITESNTDLLTATLNLAQDEEEQSQEIQQPQSESSNLSAIVEPQTAEIGTATQEQSLQTMESTPKPKKYKILAIDGGGIRAIIPTLVLAEIERRTKKPIFSLFDLIAGTSTGGILALGLTKPGLSAESSTNTPVAEYTADDLLQIFIEYGVEIFYEPFFERVIGELEDIFIQPKYPSSGREEIFRQYFGSSLLEDNLQEVFVTSYDIEQRIPILFTNKLAKEQTESKTFRKLCKHLNLTDVALATTATPTYFAPHHIPTSHNINGFYTLVDGGLIANNPTNLAVLEAQISSRQATQTSLNPEDIVVVSLGTGSLSTAYRYQETKKWGRLQWSTPLLNSVLDGNSKSVDGQLEQLFAPINQDGHSYYYRFQTFLDKELEELDNIKLNNIRKLQAVAHRLIAERSQQIDELCSLLLG